MKNYSIDLRNVKIDFAKLISFLYKQVEDEARKEVNGLCKRMNYSVVKTCADCKETYPPIPILTKREKSKNMMISLNDPEKFEKKLRKLTARTMAGGMICSHVSKPMLLGSFRRRKEGIVLSQEYGTKLNEPLNEGESPITTIRSFCYGHENLGGKEDTILDECKEKLGIPTDAIIRSIDYDTL